MAKDMLINAIDEEECRIAVLADGVVQELYVERASAEHYVGNIYKGRVTNVEPSIQAAFVDYGMPKNGFLHVSDVSPNYWPEPMKGGRNNVRRNIQNVLKRGQEVIVQISKEGIGTKGPTMTTYLSIAGRYLVLMPGLNRVGVSRKIEDDQSRHGLRDILEGLERPKNMGIIVRTAGLDQPKRELQRDLSYLTRVWKMVSDRIKVAKCPAEIYRESDLVVRTIRDIFTTDIEHIYIDDQEVMARVREFLEAAMPRYVNRVMLYEDRIPLFHKYGIEESIASIYDRRVPLTSGGYLVIDQAEALVAIDVNSGKFRSETNAEESAYKLNLEAAKEIVRQLRLRDLGGVIVMDFVDMRIERHRRDVEELLKAEMKRDRSRSKILRTSKFGLIEMTRQRMRPSIQRSAYMDCPHCAGSGMIKTPESMSLDVMRQITLSASQDEISQIQVTLHPTVGHYIHNRKRRALVKLEERAGKQIMVISDPNINQEAIIFHCQDSRGIPIKFDPHEAARQQAKLLEQKMREQRRHAPALPVEPFEDEDEPREEREVEEHEVDDRDSDDGEARDFRRAAESEEPDTADEIREFVREPGAHDEPEEPREPAGQREASGHRETSGQREPAAPREPGPQQSGQRPPAVQQPSGQPRPAGGPGEQRPAGGPGEQRPAGEGRSRRRRRRRGGRGRGGRSGQPMMPGAQGDQGGPVRAEQARAEEARDEAGREEFEPGENETVEAGRDEHETSRSGRGGRGESRGNEFMPPETSQAGESISATEAEEVRQEARRAAHDRREMTEQEVGNMETERRDAGAAGPAEDQPQAWQAEPEETSSEAAAPTATEPVAAPEAAKDPGREPSSKPARTPSAKPPRGASGRPSRGAAAKAARLAAKEAAAREDERKAAESEPVADEPSPEAGAAADGSQAEATDGIEKKAKPKRRRSTRPRHRGRRKPGSSAEPPAASD